MVQTILSILKQQKPILLVIVLGFMGIGLMVGFFKKEKVSIRERNPKEAYREIIYREINEDRKLFDLKDQLKAGQDLEKVLDETEEEYNSKDEFLKKRLESKEQENQPKPAINDKIQNQSQEEPVKIPLNKEKNVFNADIIDKIPLEDMLDLED